MSNARHVEILNSILDKIKKGITNHSEILEQLILEDIKRLKPANISTGSHLSEPPSLLFMKECLGWLKPKKYTQYAILAPKIKNYSYWLRARDPNDDLLCFIGHINLRHKNIKTKFPKDLYQILSVFFSLYTAYRDKLNTNLLGCLTNIWQDRIDRAIRLAFNGLHIPEHQTQLETLRKISSFKHWIPASRRVRISDLIIRNLQENAYSVYVDETLIMLMQLKNWIALEKRELILNALFMRIEPGKPVRLNLCNALKLLQEWQLPEEMLPRIQDQMFMLIERSLELLEKGNRVEQRCVMELLSQIMHVIPFKLHEEVLGALLNAARSKDLEIKECALNTLKFSAPIISNDNYDAVVDCIEQHIDILISDEREKVCAAACAAFGMLNQLTANIKYLPTINKLLQIMSKRENPESVRHTSLLSIGKLIHIIPSYLLDDVFDSTSAVLADKQRNISLRILAVNALASMHSRFVEVHKIISLMMGVIKDKSEDVDIRCQSIEQLSIINQWIYSENCKHFLSDLLKMASDQSEDRKILIAIYKLMATVNIDLSNEIIMSFLKPHLDGLKATDPSKRIESVQMLGHLNGLIKNELSTIVLNELINMLNDANGAVRQTTYTTLDLYKSHMHWNQKIALLSLLYSKPIEESSVLLTNLYSEHRRDVSIQMLKNIPTSIDQYRLTEDIANRVMSFT